ncbi:chromatin-remodeling ATPase INO80-like [Camellia sinensis]|uniref:chromatin-remodeling ATPase INO80-like n=1 Tax=Camellia sinensis TaxID=4442 RepID=UPI0010367845|nr:chromatin-remodeling ATPase INO80-like [Camellia sinensis]
MVGRIAKLGRRQHDAVERIGRLQSEVKGQRSKVEFEATRAAMENARAEAEKEKARTTDRLRANTEKMANASEESLKLANEALAKLEAEFEELKQAKEKADSESLAAFEAWKNSAFQDYVEERDDCIQKLEALVEKAERELRKIKSTGPQSTSHPNSIVEEKITQRLINDALIGRNTASMFAIETARITTYEKGFHDGRKIKIQKTKEKLAEEVCRCENRGFKHGWIKALQQAESLRAAGLNLAFPLHQQNDLPVSAFEIEKSDDEQDDEPKKTL